MNVCRDIRCQIKGNAYYPLVQNDEKIDLIANYNAFYYRESEKYLKIRDVNDLATGNQMVSIKQRIMHLG